MEGDSNDMGEVKRDSASSLREHNGKKQYSMLSNIVFFHRLVYQEFPQLAGYHLLSIISEILFPCFGILMPGIVVAMVERGDMFRGLTVIVAAGFVMLLCNSLSRQIWWKIYFYENMLRNMLLGWGSHEELLKDENGKYYELWHAQAQYYT